MKAQVFIRHINCSIILGYFNFRDSSSFDETYKINVSTYSKSVFFIKKVRKSLRPSLNEFVKHTSSHHAIDCRKQLKFHQPEHFLRKLHGNLTPK